MPVILNAASKFSKATELVRHATQALHACLDSQTLLDLLQLALAHNWVLLQLVY